jgi:hypothetical protein
MIVTAREVHQGRLIGKKRCDILHILIGPGLPETGKTLRNKTGVCSLLDLLEKIGLSIPSINVIGHQLLY